MALRILPIAQPCTESFADMPGDERTRFCAKCNKHVHDLSARTEREARALFHRARGERMCVRFARDPSGAVRFRAATLAVAVSLTSCSAAPVAAVTPVEVVDHEMGDGIPDEIDRCPDNTTPPDDTDGCPTPDGGLWLRGAPR